MTPVTGYRGRLFRRYAVIFTVLVSGALLTSSLVELFFSQEENQAAVVTLQRAKAVAVASAIKQFLRETVQQITWVVADPAPADTIQAEQRRRDLDKLLRQATAVREVRYLDAGGNEQIRIARDSSTPGTGPSDDALRTAFREAKGRRTYFGPTYVQGSSEPFMSIAIADDGPAGGVTVTEVALLAVREAVAQARVGQTGLAFVVDAGCQLVAHSDDGNVANRSDPCTLDEVKAARAGPFQGRQLPDNVRAIESLGERVLVVSQFESRSFYGDSGDHLVAFEAVEPLGWTVFVSQPLEEAFAGVREASLRTVLLLLLGLVLAILASLYFARQMVTPIQALQAGAARIGAGALEQRIEVRTGDELEALADQFNQMASQLRESYAGLEQKVEERTRDLAAALERLEALGEVGQVVSSSLDVGRVLDSVVSHAELLSGADGGVIYEFDETAREFRLRAARQLEAEVIEVLRANPIHLGQGAVGRAAVARRPIQVADIPAEDGYAGPLREALIRAGHRAVLAVPLLREDRILGGLVVIRKSPGEFPPDTVDLVQTFASQSALAIQNARLFREVEEKSRELEAASRHKSEFLANMSHELRTPLNAVIGFSEVLLERMFGELNDKQAEYLGDILSSGRHLLSLINDILDLSKVEAGRMELELGLFSLREALANGLTMLRERASRHGIALSLEVEDGLDLVEADERKVKQVVFNLLSNAVKFTPDGGRVEVRAHAVEGAIQVAVADTGIGIAPEDTERVFDEFRQVGQGASNSEGTGLGLALTRRFVALHGGRIWVESEPGSGSTFTFTLPLSGRAAGA